MALKTKYFDCFAGFGCFLTSNLKPALTLSDLLAEMDACGIERALVYHATQFDGSPDFGNEAVLEETAGTPRLEPTWVIAPPETGEFPAPPELAPRMLRARVRALRALPDQHRYLLSANSLSGLLAVLCERRIPLLLHKPAWNQVEELLKALPRLTLVVCGHGPWGDDRFFRPLLERCERFHIDTSRYELNGGIEALCERFGHERILFGTNFPLTLMGGPRLTLDGASISEEARNAIAAGNLERLLAEVDLS